MTFEFDAKKDYTQSVEVTDIGQFALVCTNIYFEEYYIGAQTKMGKTFILKFGPVIADLEELTENFSLEYKKINYKEVKISKEIDLFLNDSKKKIIQVQAIELAELLSKIPAASSFVPA